MYYYSQDAAGGSGALAADGGAGSSGRRYKATVEVEWADEKYPLECVKDSCGRVSVALKELRNIVCRSRAIPQATQLGAQQHHCSGEIVSRTQMRIDGALRAYRRILVHIHSIYLSLHISERTNR